MAFQGSSAVAFLSSIGQSVSFASAIGCLRAAGVN